ncbi:MAG: aminoglycoside phosphotransferase family protein [Phycisphaeraceae bacterium]|nr:aminoglycoside phosphotransferase family protein [Phycisphaeraceae bacterium]
MEPSGEAEPKQQHAAATPTLKQAVAAANMDESLLSDSSAVPLGRVIDSPLGAAFEKVLGQSCEERLSPISWFRTDWQRGGAATGYATYRDQAGVEHEVVCKLPVPPRELTWLSRLQEVDDVAPRLFASGDVLGGYDIAWVVMERLRHGPLDSQWEGREFDLLIESAARFYQAASRYPVQGEPRCLDWQKVIRDAREAVREHRLPEEQRWNTALKKAGKKIQKWAELWERRPIDGWIHGDLHLGNAMTRNGAGEGPAILFDYAEVRPGSWIEDGVYIEHLFWSRRERMGDRKLCRMISKKRKELGLPVDANWPRLAEIRRALVALSAPLTVRQDGNLRHLHASLEILEREVETA